MLICPTNYVICHKVQSTKYLTDPQKHNPQPQNKVHEYLALLPLLHPQIPLQLPSESNNLICQPHRPGPQPSAVSL